MACSGSFTILKAKMPWKVMTFKFSINELHVDFATKWDNFSCKVGQV